MIDEINVSVVSLKRDYNKEKFWVLCRETLYKSVLSLS